MMIKPNMMLTVFAMVLIFLLAACNDADTSKKQPSSDVTSKKISVPAVQKKLPNPADNKNDMNTPSKKQMVPAEEKKLEKDPPIAPLADILNKPKAEHYNSKGKIDPFRPLIQEKSEGPAIAVDNRPKRILTPLEKIELTQIKLVAVITMKNRKIAMVEEANGKGYEVVIGTYMGKNQGRVFEIRENSLLIREVVRNFKGQLKEKVQEIKIHKNDSEE